jgi:hypothetical protein
MLEKIAMEKNVGIGQKETIAQRNHFLGIKKFWAKRNHFLGRKNLMQFLNSFSANLKPLGIFKKVPFGKINVLYLNKYFCLPFSNLANGN